MDYSEKLKDSRWQKKRLKIFERDEWKCQICGLTEQITLHCHHCYYEKGKDPWEYPDESLITLCEECHEEEQSDRIQAEEELIKTLREHGWLSTNLVDLSNHIEWIKREKREEFLFILGFLLDGGKQFQSLLDLGSKAFQEWEVPKEKK